MNNAHTTELVERCVERSAKVEHGPTRVRQLLSPG